MFHSDPLVVGDGETELPENMENTLWRLLEENVGPKVSGVSEVAVG